VNDPDNQVHAYVDLTSPALCTSWPEQDLTAAFQQTNDYLLRQAHELIVARDPARRHTMAGVGAWGLIGAWQRMWSGSPLAMTLTRPPVLDRGVALGDDPCPPLLMASPPFSFAGPGESQRSSLPESDPRVPGLHEIDVRWSGRA
jgi:hypothetical protein